MIVLVDLKLIDDNPFQTRQSYPADAIVELAEFAASLKIDLTVVGPEGPLSTGLPTAAGIRQRFRLVAAQPYRNEEPSGEPLAANVSLGVGLGSRWRTLSVLHRSQRTLVDVTADGTTALPRLDQSRNICFRSKG